MTSVLIPVAIFAALGVLAGVLLTAASKIFAVEVDERVDLIADALVASELCTSSTAKTL